MIGLRPQGGSLCGQAGVGVIRRRLFRQMGAVGNRSPMAENDLDASASPSCNVVRSHHHHAGAMTQSPTFSPAMCERAVRRVAEARGESVPQGARSNRSGPEELAWDLCVQRPRRRASRGRTRPPRVAEAPEATDRPGRVGPAQDDARAAGGSRAGQCGGMASAEAREGAMASWAAAEIHRVMPLAGRCPMLSSGGHLMHEVMQSMQFSSGPSLNIMAALESSAHAGWSRSAQAWMRSQSTQQCDQETHVKFQHQ